MRTLVLTIFVTAVTPVASLASDWPKYCSNLEMTGVAQSGGNISIVSARNLTVRWTIPLGGPVASSPTIVNDRLYVGDWGGYEWAIDTATGRVLGSINLGVTTAPQCFPSTLGITSSPAYDNGMIYLAGGDDNFYAINALTMNVEWKQKLGDNTAGYYGWCSPAAANGVVFQGVSSNCDSPLVPGQLIGLDTNGGQIVANGTLMPNQPGDARTLVGGGIWTSPAIDQATQSVFVTTGSAGNLGDGYSYSIVRLSLPDLRVMDYWKLPEMIVYDSDWGTSPTLFTDAEGDLRVGAGQKDGGYYAFNRANLLAGPIWRAPIARGGDCPQCGDGVLSTAAFDGERLYVGSGQLAGDTSGHLGGVTALSAADGHIIWQTPLNDAVIAPIAYANGVLFTTAGKALVAINAANGEILSTVPTRAGCFGGVAITDEGIFFGDLSGMLYRVTANDPPRRRTVNSK